MRDAVGGSGSREDLRVQVRTLQDWAQKFVHKVRRVSRIECRRENENRGGEGDRDFASCRNEEGFGERILRNWEEGPVCIQSARERDN